MRQRIFLKFLIQKIIVTRFLHNIGNAKWNINNFELKAHRVMCIDHFHVDCF